MEFVHEIMGEQIIPQDVAAEYQHVLGGLLFEGSNLRVGVGASENTCIGPGCRLIDRERVRDNDFRNRIVQLGDFAGRRRG